jgi:hypothetical protein
MLTRQLQNRTGKPMHYTFCDKCGRSDGFEKDTGRCLHGCDGPTSLEGYTERSQRELDGCMCWIDPLCCFVHNSELWSKP